MTAAWGQHQLATGVAAIDNVVDEMHALSWSFDGELETPSATFISSHAVSATNVASALAGLEGIRVELVDTGGVINPSDIVDEGVDDNGERILVFSVGWDDCAVGCRQGHFWSTAISGDGSATLRADWGDAPPPAIVELYATPAPYF